MNTYWIVTGARRASVARAMTLIFKGGTEEEAQEKFAQEYWKGEPESKRQPDGSRQTLAEFERDRGTLIFIEDTIEITADIDPRFVED